jgi:hypothetical protein
LILPHPKLSSGTSQEDLLRSKFILQKQRFSADIKGKKDRARSVVADSYYTLLSFCTIAPPCLDQVHGTKTALFCGY